MNDFSKKIFSALILLIIVIIYSPWFLHKDIIGGDWPYFQVEMLKGYPLIAPLWSSDVLGQINQNFSLFSYQNFVINFFFNTLSIPWGITYRIFWFFLFIFLSAYSIRSLIKAFFQKADVLQIFLGILLYLTNTYVLMIAGGGQMGVLLAYSVAPLILAKFINLIDDLNSKKNHELKYSFTAGLFLSLLILFDLRLAYIIILAVILYFLINLKLSSSKIAYSILNIFIIPFLITFLIHAYWIFPFLYFHLFSLPKGLTSIEGFSFFSFGDFSHSLSLLHPNWPENIFGKTYFMKSEFIFLPVLAYLSLLFAKGRKMLFFVLLGLIGAFLAKGINPPFGFVNKFIFEYVAGMGMFRDPSKFYLLIIISYSILIPFSLFKLSDWISHRKFSIFNFQNLFLLLIFSYILVLVHPAFFGRLGGTFRNYVVPKEYESLKQFIVNQPQYFSTLWIPVQSRFRVQTETHPLINAEYFFFTSDPYLISKKINNDDTKTILENAGVKYLIIPDDSIGEIFIKDRKYDPQARINLEKEIDKITWLKKIIAGKISVYELSNHKDLFWLENSGTITYKKTSISEYKLNIKTRDKNLLVFANTFNNYWMINNGDSSLPSKLYQLNKGVDFNSFELPKGDYKVKIYFEPQRFINIGYLFSFSFLIIIIFYLVKNRNHK